MSNSTENNRQKIHELAAAGVPQVEIARQLGVAQSTVSNVLRAARRSEPVRGPVTKAVEALVGDSGDLRAALALALAAKLDACARSETSASMTAMPNLCTKLLETVRDLVDAQATVASANELEKVLAPLQGLALR